MATKPLMEAARRLVNHPDCFFLSQGEDPEDQQEADAVWNAFVDALVEAEANNA